ncbi:MAG: hypothetical protein H3C71_07535, partial [Flavobacteriales bacterium]|nr:hypothetical protein [Flavobacteriales bacterium]
MKHHFISFLSLLTLLLLNACMGDKGIMPRSTGKEGELLLIVDEKYWHHPVGDTLKQYLLQEFPAIP